MITILGSGGHGWQSLANFLNYDCEFEFFLMTFDWGQVNFGGFNGTWGRILEWENNRDNLILHPLPGSLAMPILPCGDLNKILMYFWKQKLGEIGSNLDVRSDNLTTLQDLWAEMIHQVNFEEYLVLGFEKYLPLAFEIYSKGKKHLNLEARGPSLGYFWHTFLIWQSWRAVLDNYKPKNDGVASFISGGFANLNAELNAENTTFDNLNNGASKKSENEIFRTYFDKVVAKFNDFYHQSGVLPQNIFINWTSCQREILVGSDGFVEIVGEELLDEWEKPILPESLKIKTTELEDIKNEKRFLEKLLNSEQIIIPTGSITNWLPLVNELEIRQILVEKSQENKLIWIHNSHPNDHEFSMEIYQKYLQELDIMPKIIFTENLGKEEAKSFVSQSLAKLIKINTFA
jgi:hypothetical protein